MKLQDKKIGIALTGSFCTYSKIWDEIVKLTEQGADVQTIFSNHAQSIDSRFGKAQDFLKKAEELTGKSPSLQSLRQNLLVLKNSVISSPFSPVQEILWQNSQMGLQIHLF